MLGLPLNICRDVGITPLTFVGMLGGYLFVSMNGNINDKNYLAEKMEELVVQLSHQGIEPWGSPQPPQPSQPLLKSNPTLAPEPDPEHQNKSVIKGLAIAQLIIGVLNVIIGFACAADNVEHGTFTITSILAPVVGAWFAVTGIIGICHAKNRGNTTLNKVYMAFSIISVCLSVIGIVIGTLGGIGFHGPFFSLLLSAVEFFVSIVAIVFCCMNGGCC